ncbi:hypothetical protein NEAUS03_2070 [Nematocida ausubeli]|nr:hypothetical protein NEAUS03_2070 [Nematocida ausubeli]
MNKWLPPKRLLPSVSYNQNIPTAYTNNIHNNTCNTTYTISLICNRSNYIPNINYSALLCDITVAEITELINTLET